MTTPHERTRAVIHTREFLGRLSISAAVPGGVRSEAERLLRHYPDAGCMEQAAAAWPSTWATVSGAPPSAPSYLELVLQEQARIRLKWVRLRRLARNNRHCWPRMTLNQELESMKEHYSWRWLLWQQHEQHYAFARNKGRGRLMALGHAVAWMFKRRAWGEHD